MDLDRDPCNPYRVLEYMRHMDSSAGRMMEGSWRRLDNSQGQGQGLASAYGSGARTVFRLRDTLAAAEPQAVQFTPGRAGDMRARSSSAILPPPQQQQGVAEAQSPALTPWQSQSQSLPSLPRPVHLAGLAQPRQGGRARVGPLPSTESGFNSPALGIQALLERSGPSLASFRPLSAAAVTTAGAGSAAAAPGAGGHPRHSSSAGRTRPPWEYGHLTASRAGYKGGQRSGSDSITASRRRSTLVWQGQGQGQRAETVDHLGPSPGGLTATVAPGDTTISSTSSIYYAGAGGGVLGLSSLRQPVRNPDTLGEWPGLPGQRPRSGGKAVLIPRRGAISNYSTIGFGPLGLG